MPDDTHNIHKTLFLHGTSRHGKHQPITQLECTDNSASQDVVWYCVCTLVWVWFGMGPSYFWSELVWYPFPQQSRRACDASCTTTPRHRTRFRRSHGLRRSLLGKKWLLRLNVWKSCRCLEKNTTRNGHVSRHLQNVKILRDVRCAPAISRSDTGTIFSLFQSKFRVIFTLQRLVPNSNLSDLEGKHAVL